MENDLSKLLQSKVHYSENCVKYILYHVVMGCKFLHDYGILHRSLSASCVGIDENYDIKIRNWGHALYIDAETERLSAAEEVKDDANLYCLAPEIIVGQCDFNPNMDVWSIGILALQIANGEMPFVT